MSTDQLVAQYLEKLRLNLLDLSGRNRLLNFKFSERSRTQVRIIDELPNYVFEELEKGTLLKIKSLPEPSIYPLDEEDDDFLLLLEAMRDADQEYMEALEALDEVDQNSEEFQQIERKLRDKVREELEMSPLVDIKILSKTDYAKQLGINPDYEQPTLQAQDGEKSSHSDSDLQTLLYPDELERKLAGLREGARKSIQETGLNRLYIAFGMLEWYEADQSDKRLLAPLLLYPVTLERQLRKEKYYYAIKSLGEGLEENFSLRERLRHDCGIVLPFFNPVTDVDEEAVDTPESYFEKVSHIIRDRKRWRVRRFMTLSLFSFGGIALFQDLNPERWPDSHSILKHPLILSIFCGQPEISESTISPDYEVDNPAVAQKVPLLVTDADASQFSAIVDSIDGKNLVIQGPPGTGKSQTITNLIAAALAKGKKVLFMAEKKAALEVVYNRLSNAGLANYCLEGHSTATSKQTFYEQLKKRVEQTPPLDVSEELAIQIKECCQLKEQLSRYVLLLNQPFGKTGKTIQELFWISQRTNDLINQLSLPSNLAVLRDEKALEMTDGDFERKRQNLKEFRQHHKSFSQKYGHIESHPWFGMTTYDLSPIDQDDLCANGREWARVLGQLQSCCKQIEGALGLQFQTTLLELQKLKQQLESCPELTSMVDQELLSRLKDSRLQDSANLLAKQITGYRDAENCIRKVFKSGTVALPDSAQLKNILLSLESVNIDDQKYSIDELKILGQQAAEICKNIERYSPVVSQIAAFFDITDYSLSPNNIEAIATAIQVLNNNLSCVLELRSPEICNPSNRHIFLDGRERSEKIKSLQGRLGKRYNLSACKEASLMRRYASTLRSANFLTYLFDSDYKEAWETWKKIRKNQNKLSDSEIAQQFDELASFLEEKDKFRNDKRFRQTCGSRFKGLDTDFDSLIAVNNLIREVSEKLSSYSLGKHIINFFAQADASKLQKVSRLQASQKFNSLLDLLGSCKLEKGFDEHKSWEELKKNYDAVASVATQACQDLNSFRLQPLFSISAIPDLIQEIENLNALKKEIEISEAYRALDISFQEEKFDVCRLEETVIFAESVSQARLPEAIKDCLLSVDAISIATIIRSKAQELSKLLKQEATFRSAFFTQGQPNSQLMFGVLDVITLSLEKLMERINQAVLAKDDLSAWINYHRAYQKVVDDGLECLLDSFQQENLPLDQLENVYQFIFYRSILRFVYQQHPELSQFSGTNQAQAREQFQQADKKLLKLYQKQLVAQLGRVHIESGKNRGRRSEWTNLALIQNEINKQKRHIPQRDLFRRASVALQQLKPCWMMSPASVAQFIPPGSITFDLLIIDEASQMRPEEALGSIARAKQIVVVGDPKQLPPTDFFKTRFDQEDEETLDDESNALDDESILDMALKVFYPARRLKWHYRSRHESLIAFSNQNFYENSLTVFPSPNNKFAVEYHYVTEGSYRSGANVPEAMAVAAAAADFMRQHPDLSIGIVTLNQKQQELLLDEMDRLFAVNPELEQYRFERENTLEPFFVKNLENVQGDERDVIFISTVYGPERPGMPVMQRFGPINSRNGHRRLNVLFTRAKEQVVVFSSMKSSDIRPAPTSNTGVKILQKYLEYAQTQQLQTAVITGRAPDSDFEVFVAERLQQHGYEIVPQVGVSGYFIDLAVVDPEQPNTYLLGIECDGATYHSSKAARDRDRLRQQVLEHLGWKLYRIWSTDWFSNPTAETEKLICHIKALSFTKTALEQS